jgi:hypothetical protein
LVSATLGRPTPKIVLLFRAVVAPRNSRNWWISQSTPSGCRNFPVHRRCPHFGRHCHRSAAVPSLRPSPSLSHDTAVKPLHIVCRCRRCPPPKSTSHQARRRPALPRLIKVRCPAPPLLRAHLHCCRLSLTTNTPPPPFGLANIVFIWCRINISSGGASASGK